MHIQYTFTGWSKEKFMVESVAYVKSLFERKIYILFYSPKHKTYIKQTIFSCNRKSAKHSKKSQKP